MLRILVAVILLLCTTLPAADQPKLVVAIAVDQFRYDYLTRYRAEFKGGLHRMLNEGAVLVNANLEHYPTVTAIGHATYLTGAKPAFSGIIGNDWFDRDTGRVVTSVSDSAERRVGGSEGTGASPRRLLVSTVGDELKAARGGATRVIGISMKDRSAILPAGHRADAAYWYDGNTGNFVTSTYYLPSLPAWAEAFNKEGNGKRYAGRAWAETRKVAEAAPELYTSVVESPFGNELLAQFAERALEHERLGQRGVTDILTLSFSSNDAVGHKYGPDGPEARELTLATDRVLAGFFATLDKLVGMRDVLVILTADHGVAPVPEVLAQNKMPGGRTSSSALFGKLTAGLEARYGPGKWILHTAGSSPYLNHDLIREKKLDEREVRRVAADIMLNTPRVLRVHTREELLAGQVPPDRFGRRVVQSYNARRSGDLEALLEPYWIRSSEGATHGTPYSYDAHIPLIFMGRWIKPGRYYQAAALNDVAPTLATILDVEIPSGSDGRVLGELLQDAAATGRPAAASRKQPAAVSGQ